ncbi:hypothetical protein V6N13_074717 [Hibiscus sabdariffa]
MVGVEGARVLEKVHGVKIVNLSCKLIDMEASIVHNVNSNVNMGSHILLVDIEFCLDSGSGFKNDVGLTKETRNKEKATPELSFRDMVVRKNQNDSLVLEISKNKRSMARKDGGRISDGNMSYATNGNRFDALNVEDKDMSIQNNGWERIRVDLVVATQINGKAGSSNSGTGRHSMGSTIVVANTIVQVVGKTGLMKKAVVPEESVSVGGEKGSVDQLQNIVLPKSKGWLASLRIHKRGLSMGSMKATLPTRLLLEIGLRICLES